MVESEHRNQPNRWSELEIVGCETIRETDGLAMSSRNRYLDAVQRKRALGLSRALFAARDLAQIESDVTVERFESLIQQELAACGLAIDYAVVCDSATLMPIDKFSKPARALIAARVDHVRLIDNIAITNKKT
jgi:pantoate--beta-alanine ligase